MKKIKILITALIAGVSAYPARILAASAGPFDKAAENLKSGGEAAYGAGAPTDLPVLVGSIINGFLLLLGIVLTIIVIRGGFMYMTAGGNEEQTKKAKAWIINGIIGMILIILAYAISSYVISAIIGAKK